MRSILFLLFGAAWTALVPTAAAAEQPPSVPNTITDGEILVLPRTSPDRQYQLYIGLPASFRAEPTRKYPVIYVTDGYWSYSTVRAMYWSLLYDKTMPEAIVVGLGYAGDKLDYEALRGEDLSPPSRSGNVYQPEPVTTGRADQFLQMIETVAIPLLERDYRADPQQRVLMGGSLGGLFSLYALYTKPGLFQGYVAASPVLSQLWQYEEDFARSGAEMKARLFVSVGGMESVTYQNEVKRFNERLATRPYLKGRYQYQYFGAMRHDGAIMQGSIEGLQSVLEPVAPEHGRAPELAPELQAGQYYVIHFNRTALLGEEAQWTPAQAEAMQRHRLRLDELVRSKQVLVFGRTLDGSARTYANVGVATHDRSVVERLAAADPAVLAGLMTYEIIFLGDKPAG